MADRYGMPDEKDIERERIRKADAEADRIADEWGCDYCRNDGKLTDGRCPKCDAEYDD